MMETYLTSQRCTVPQRSPAQNSFWEYGTYQTALLELNAPELFLYNGSNAIPPTLTSDSDVTKLFASVDAVLAAKPAGIKPFFSDKAVGDPASVGIPFLIRNWTLTTGSTKYATAASQQLDYLLNDVDRTDNGAISQRTNVVQVWADFMTMAPPFIAYYGAITNNYATLLEGYTQLADYHDILFDSSAGMMQHILLGTSSIDTGHWGTGNGWACHGMLRVLRTIQLSNYANSLKSQQSDLLGWVSTILTNVWKHQQSSGALLNYIDGSTSSSSVFPDASGTALLAAATFRLASLVYGTSNAPTVNIAAAEKARVWVVQQVGADGWLKNGTMVDPYNWHQSGSRSPEAHSFVLMLTAAYRDWQSATKGYYN
ncbi:hypothetical protein DL93DRAFT_2127462 [Clavulina sp. PMI_390]|nr:hypothetical protein DL93DRAFT_2127462 [Clavulina sp. PMI_390]